MSLYWFVILVFLAGLVFGVIFTTVYVYHRAQALLESLQQQSTPAGMVDDTDTMAVLCEYTDSLYLAYDPHNMSFLAQGKTLEDLLAALDQRLSGSGRYHIHTDPATADRLRQETLHHET